MTDFNKNNPFKIPENYFQELEYLLIENTKNTSVKNNLSTPKDYFNTLEKEILKEIYQSQLNHSGWSLPKTGFGWRTNSYENIFSESDNDYLIAKSGINGLSLLQNRKRHHKRGYYGLYSFASWFQQNGR